MILGLVFALSGCLGDLPNEAACKADVTKRHAALKQAMEPVLRGSGATSLLYEHDCSSGDAGYLSWTPPEVADHGLGAFVAAGWTRADLSKDPFIPPGAWLVERTVDGRTFSAYVDCVRGCDGSGTIR